MKALAVFPRQRKLGLVDHPVPDISGKHEVKLRMLDVGICGTDREIARFDYGTPPEGDEYLILGHESLGEVVETGASVTRVKPGDLVMPSVRRPCDPPCPACASGRLDLCMTGRYRERGIVGQHGFLSELVVEQEQFLNLIPHTLRQIGVMAEPLTVAEKAFSTICKIQQRLPVNGRSSARATGETALILGAGPVGLLAAMKLRLEGYRVFVYSRGSECEKPPLAQAIGAVFLASEEVKPETLSEACGGQIDVVFEALGAADLAFEVLGQLGWNGIFAFTGVPRHSHDIPVDTSRLLRNVVLKNQVIFGTVSASSEDFKNSIRDLERFRIEFPGIAESLITARHPIERYSAPLATNIGIKNVIAF
jgi:threonine dehydrogenase-like Zn-dependent dehydrogenase